jgi:hypothetical protein
MRVLIKPHPPASCRGRFMALSHSLLALALFIKRTQPHNSCQTPQRSPLGWCAVAVEAAEEGSSARLGYADPSRIRVYPRNDVYACDKRMGMALPSAKGGF